MRRPLVLAIVAAALSVPVSAAQDAARPAPLDHLRIVAPAAPGGGWDQTARAMQHAIQAQGLARIVQVENIVGAAGTIGLARFVKGTRRDEPALLVTGLVMQSAIVANQAPVSLGRVTPIARLTGEYEVIVVPAASPFRTLGDLVDALRRDPGAVSWAGGSAGGTDQLLVALLARAAGVPPARANYIAFSGGGESLVAIVGSQVSAGVAGYSEFAPHIAAGSLRALAVSAPSRVEGIDVPTILEQGYDIVLANWRGIVGPANAAPELRQRLGDLVARMHTSASWRATLARYGWMDLYLPPEAFRAFLEREQASIEAIILSLRSGSDVAPLARSGATVFPIVIGAGLLVIGLLLAFDRRKSGGGLLQPCPASPDTSAEAAGTGGARLQPCRPARVRAALYLALGALSSLAALHTAGFVVSSTILFWCTARAFGSARWLRDLAIGLALVLAAYVVFTRGLSLALPTGILDGLV